MNASNKELELFYFNALNQKLFGCYHRPQSSQKRNCGVILCYPMADEYIRLHRAYLLLAQRLSRAGFPTLRFDYSGCGDSYGTSEEVAPGQWQVDIKNAIIKLKQMCKLDKLCLVGFRLGGTLSAMVGAEINEIDGMVLCDPVVTGKVYVGDLRKIHKRMLQVAQVVNPTENIVGNNLEVLGFSINDSLRTEIESLNLFKLERKPASKVLIVQSGESNQVSDLATHLASLGCFVDCQVIPVPDLWEWIEDIAKIQIPHQIIQAVVSWISERYE